MNSIMLIERVRRHFPDISAKEIEHLYNKYIADLCRELRFGLSDITIDFENGVYQMTEYIHKIQDVYFISDGSLVYAHWIQPQIRLADGVKLLGSPLPVWWTHLNEVFLGYPDADDDNIIKAIDETVAAKLYGKFGIPYQPLQEVIDVTTTGSAFANLEYADLFDDYNITDIALLAILGELYMLIPEGLERSVIYKQEFEREKYKLKKYLKTSRTKNYRELKGVRIA